MLAISNELRFKKSKCTTSTSQDRVFLICCPRVIDSKQDGSSTDLWKSKLPLATGTTVLSEFCKLCSGNATSEDMDESVVVISNQPCYCIVRTTWRIHRSRADGTTWLRRMTLRRRFWLHFPWWQWSLTWYRPWQIANLQQIITNSDETFQKLDNSSIILRGLY